MRVFDVFSGIGGMSLGLDRAGFETVGFCEIEPFCQLTPAMRASLSRSTGEAYIKAYTAAREWLRERAHPAVTRVE